MLLLDEIRSQPEVLEKCLAENVRAASDARSLLESSEHVVIAARGTSDNAARYAKYVWGSKLGLPVTLAAPSLYTRYRQPPSLRRATVVAISQSGYSPDLLAVIEEGRRQGRPTVAITNDTQSPLAELVDVIIPLHAGIERSVAATKSYTTSLLIAAMVTGDLEPLAAVPDAVAATLTAEEAIATEARRVRPMRKAVVLGRGFNHSTAFEWALKLQEMAYVFAHAFSTADFAHGPFAILEDGFPVLALLPAGHISADSLAVLRRARDETGANVSVITNIPIDDLATIMTPPIPEWLSPLTFITVAQLHSLHTAQANGIDPESPRGLQKVTMTT
jgi:glucosamine--fructose-6-phosphate aminotransferase (isomerizing)